MIEIVNRYTRAVLYKAESAESVRDALIEAVQKKADLRGADLRGADLSGADLRSAYLRSADLRSADLGGANLGGADLRSANLGGANLGGADLRSAYLRSADLRSADLGGANLGGADLRSADLGGADLGGADLGEIRDDLYKILELVPDEVPALLAALEGGKVDGSTYTGECACLVGTVANARKCNYASIPGLVPNAYRPAEKWFVAIREGDTPESNSVSAITVGWVKEWMAKNSQPVAAAPEAP
jgi:hypothetical protein